MDLRSLAGLQFLEKLELDDVRFLHLNAFTALPNLKSLTLIDRSQEGMLFTQVPTRILRELVTLTNLESLTLRGTGITRLAEIGNFPNLRTLSLGENRNLDDLSGLGEMKNLVELDLSGTNVSDFSELQNLSSLESLDLDYISLDDLPEEEQVRQIDHQ